MTFTVGQRVRCVQAKDGHRPGDVCTITSISDDGWWLRFNNAPTGCSHLYFEPADAPHPDAIAAANVAAIYGVQAVAQDDEKWSFQAIDSNTIAVVSGDETTWYSVGEPVQWHDVQRVAATPPWPNTPPFRTPSAAPTPPKVVDARAAGVARAVDALSSADPRLGASRWRP